MGVVALERDPRIMFFGNITGIPVDTLNRFLKSAGPPPYAGSFPSCPNDQAAEVVRKTYELLTQAAIDDSSPITPCKSDEERIRQILQSPALLTRQDAIGRPVLIIDRNPRSLVRAVASMSEDPQRSLLSHTTVINLGPGEPFDYVDPNTNVRVVTLPPYCYPTHPTPDS